MSNIAIMIIHSQPFFRAGLRQALTELSHFEHIEITECAPDRGGEIAMEQIAANSPGVVLVDVEYPTLGGLELAKTVSRKFPGTKVIMLSTNPSDDYEELLEVIKTGAAAYLKTRDSTTKALADTIERVCDGEYPINDCVWSKPEAALLVLRQFQYLTTFGKTFEETISPLSPREKQILTYIADGNSNKQISVIFGVSEQTIKNHVSAILRKLNANDRAHAVYIAISKGLVPGKTYSYLN